MLHKIKRSFLKNNKNKSKKKSKNKSKKTRGGANKCKPLSYIWKCVSDIIGVETSEIHQFYVDLMNNEQELLDNLTNPYNTNLLNAQEELRLLANNRFEIEITPEQFEDIWSCIN